MSIHHSKGLEYPVCFIYQCEKQFNEEFKKAPFLLEPSLGIGFLYHDETGFAKYQSPFMASISDTISVLQREEEMRVLYVAMTRARDRLIMTYASPSLESDLKDIVLRQDFDGGELVCQEATCMGDWVLLAALQRSPMANPKSLKDKAQDKCLICRQVGHWAKECPNRDKSPRTACHKCHQLGHWAALCPRDPRASRSSAKPTLTMVQED